MTRLRRAIKIVGPVRFVVSCVLGATITILIAWWVATAPGSVRLFPEPRSGLLEYAVVGHDDTVEVTFISDKGGLVFVFSERERATVFSLMEQSSVARDWHRIDPDRRPDWVGGLALAERSHPGMSVKSHNELGYGWPAVALIARQARDGRGNNPWTSAWMASVGWPRSVNTTGRPVPLGPHGRGFLLDTLFYALPAYALLSIPACISGARRRLTNRCHRCGYKLDGLASDTCPECGHAIRVRPTDSEPRA
ncbi:MAG: hypothetical protein H6810_04390 [Phycisphaeraceae bacterium]|nr:MAG: hypothetical protein H6810_04390 [Phycisphaeraceae bacterium]